MTYKETYEYFKDYFGETRCGEKACKHCAAIKSMFSAIKKQIPKYPTMETHTYFGMAEDEFENTYHCRCVKPNL